MTRTVPFLRAAFAAGLLMSGVRGVAAQTQTCQNTISLSGTQTTTHSITAKGIYCLTTDVILASTFTGGGPAISIAADNVVLDLNGHRVGGSSVASGSAVVGIQAIGHHGITIKNGLVRGFYDGIELLGGTDSSESRMNVVEDIVAEDNRFSAIRMEGDGTVVRRNRVRGTGEDSSGGMAIWVQGANARIVDNQVIGRDPTGSITTGIYLSSAPGSLVEGNQVGNDAPPPENNIWTAISVGTGSDSVLVVGNRIANWRYGISAGLANVKCRDNLFNGVDTMLSGCTDAGNNN